MARPPVLPTWATSATYPAGANDWSGQPPRVQPASGTLAQGFTPAADMPAEYVNWLIGVIADWLSYFDDIYNGVRALKGLIVDPVGGAVDAPFARTADSPLVLFRDSAKNNRGMVDHLGYRHSRLSEYYEDWLSIGLGIIGGGGAVSANGRVRYDVGAAHQIFADAFSQNMPGGGHLGLLIGGASGVTTRVLSPAIFSPGTYTSLVIDFEVLVSLSTNVDFRIGIVGNGSSGAQSATGTPGADHAFALVKQAADTHWFLQTGNGSAFTKTDTTITPSTTLGAPDRVRLELHGSGSPYGSKHRVWINDALVIDASLTNPPTNTSIGMSFLVAATTTGASANGVMRLSPVRMTWNRYLSQPLI